MFNGNNNKMVKKLIINSNEWYDNLPDIKRDLVFLFVILVWRISYTIIQCYKDFKTKNENI